MRWSAAVVISILIAIAIAVLIVMLAALAVDHDAVVPMPVPLTALNPDAADPNLDVFRDDHWVVADVHRTGKRRHRQEWNETKDKHSILGILHGTLFDWGRSMSRCPLQCALHAREVCIGLTSTVLDASP
jgi:hypothetical protein